MSGRTQADPPNIARARVVLTGGEKVNHRSDFLVLTTERTGSQWVIDLLNRVEEFKVYGELFLPQKRYRPETVCNDYPRFIEFEGRQRGPMRSRSVFRYLDDLYQQPSNVGFKFMYSQARVFPLADQTAREKPRLGHRKAANRERRGLRYKY